MQSRTRTMSRAKGLTTIALAWSVAAAVSVGSMYATAALKLPAADRLVVPRSALIETGTRRVVYVETAPNTFTARNVTVGAVAADRVEILDGVKEGERVVTQANFFIDAQAQLSNGQSIQWSGAREVKTSPTEARP